MANTNDGKIMNGSAAESLDSPSTTIKGKHTKSNARTYSRSDDPPNPTATCDTVVTRWWKDAPQTCRWPATGAAGWEIILDSPQYARNNHTYPNTRDMSCVIYTIVWINPNARPFFWFLNLVYCRVWINPNARPSFGFLTFYTAVWINPNARPFFGFLTFYTVVWINPKVRPYSGELRKLSRTMLCFINKGGIGRCSRSSLLHVHLAGSSRGLVINVPDAVVPCWWTQ